MFLVFKKELILLLFSVAILVSCSNNSKTEELRAYDFNDLAYNIDLISIKPTKSGQLISIVEKLKVEENNRFYILAGNNQFMLQVFDIESNLLFSSSNAYDSLGRVVFVNDFEIYEKQLFVLDSKKQEIFVYSIDNFNLIRNIHIPFYAKRISVLKNGNIVLFKNEQAVNFESEEYFYNIIVLDSYGKFIKGLEPFEIAPGSRRTISASNPFFSFENDVYYLKPFNDTIFRFEENSYSEFYIMNNTKKRYTLQNHIDRKEITNEQVTPPLFFVRNDDVMGYWYSDSKYLSCEFFKVEQFQKLFKSKGFNYDKIGKLPYPLVSDKNNFYSIIDEKAIMNFNLFDNLDSNLIRNIDENGEIILIKYSFYN